MRCAPRLENKPFRGWAKRVRVPAVVMSERESHGVTLVGIEPEREKGLSFIGTAVQQGAYLKSGNDSGIILGAKLVDLLRTELGKRVVLMSQDTEGEIADRGFRITGIFEADQESTEKRFAFVGIRTAQKMLRLSEQISEVSALTENREQLTGVLSQLRSVAPELSILSWSELEPLVVAIVELQGGFLIIWFLIVVVVVAFGLVNTLFMSIFERTRELGLVQALGMSPRLVILEIVLESIVLLSLGAVVGILGSFVSFSLLRNGIDLSYFAAGADYFGMSRMLYPKFVASDWMIATALVFLIGILSSLYPAWKASRLVPVDALTRST